MSGYDDRPSGRFMLLGLLMLIAVILVVVVGSTHAHISVGQAF